MRGADGEWGVGVAFDVSSVGHSPAVWAVARVSTIPCPKIRQDFWQAVPLTFQGAEVGRRPVGVMCHVLPGEDEDGRGAHGPPGLLPRPVQPDLQEPWPAPVRPQPVSEYRFVCTLLVPHCTCTLELLTVSVESVGMTKKTITNKTLTFFFRRSTTRINKTKKKTKQILMFFFRSLHRFNCCICYATLCIFMLLLATAVAI